MIAMTLPIMQWFGNSILEAKRRNRFRSLASLITVSIAVLVAIFLVPKYQLKGVIYPLFIAMLLNGFIMTWYFYKIFGFDFLVFIKKAVIKLILAVSPIVLVFSYIKNFWKVESWIDLALHTSLFAIVYSAILYFIIMNVEEKKIIINRL
jgi:peptidoglycan biosynthesis protein MviN/MurJ (putative lipid II flippase)